MERRQPNIATRRLWEQMRARHMAEVNDIAAVALEADGLNPTDGWRFDVMTGELVRQDGPEE